MGKIPKLTERTKFRRRAVHGRKWVRCSHRDGEESDCVAVGELRLVGGALLEHQVAATAAGGVGAERPETGGVVYSE